MSKREFTMLAKVYASWLGSFRLAYLTASHVKTGIMFHRKWKIPVSRVSNNRQDWRRQASRINWKRNVVLWKWISLSNEKEFCVISGIPPHPLWPRVNEWMSKRERKIARFQERNFEANFGKSRRTIILPLSSKTFLEINIFLSLSFLKITRLKRIYFI